MPRTQSRGVKKKAAAGEEICHHASYHHHHTLFLPILYAMPFSCVVMFLGEERKTLIPHLSLSENILLQCGFWQQHACLPCPTGRQKEKEGPFSLYIYAIYLSLSLFAALHCLHTCLRTHTHARIGISLYFLLPRRISGRTFCKGDRMDRFGLCSRTFRNWNWHALRLSLIPPRTPCTPTPYLLSCTHRHTACTFLLPHTPCLRLW